MLILSDPADLIDVVCSPGTSGLSAHCAFMDADGSVVTPNRQNSNFTGGSTGGTLVDGPGSGIERAIKSMFLYSGNAGDIDVTIRRTSGGVTVVLLEAVLSWFDTIGYVDGQGFRVYSRGAVEK